MSFSMQVGFMVPGTIGPLTGETPPQPSKAKLSNQTYTSSDTTVFTVAADTTNATGNGFVVSGIGTVPAGSTQISATLTAKATATEPDGTTTEVIQGVTTIILTAAPPPPPPPAASLGFTFGTPTPLPPPVPPAPGVTHA